MPSSLDGSCGLLVSPHRDAQPRRVVNVPSVAAIRARTGLSQPKFTVLLGVSVRTLQEWEQGRRAPSGAARTLLMVAAKNPKVLLGVA